MKKTILRFYVTGLFFMCVSAVFAQNGAQNPRNYADSLIASSGVIAPQNAVDNHRNNYAVLQTDVGASNQANIKTGFYDYGVGGQRVDVEIQNDGGILSADVLATISISVYDSHGTRIARKIGFDVTEAQLIQNTSHYKLSLTTPKTAIDIASVAVHISGLAALENRVQLYNIWTVTICPAVFGDILHSSHNVTNPGNAVSPDQSDYALLTPPLTSDNSYLDVEFSQRGTGGRSVKFLLGEGNVLLNASLLSKIRLTVYDTKGNIVANQTGFTLEEAELLPDGKFNLSIHTPNGSYQTARARITFSSLSSVLTLLKVYKVTTGLKCGAQNMQEDALAKNPIASISLDVAPNPFNSYTTLNFKGNLSNPANIIISDKSGNVVEQHQVTGASSVRLLEKVPAGIYFVKITSGTMVEVRKVIKL